MIDSVAYPQVTVEHRLLSRQEALWLPVLLGDTHISAVRGLVCVRGTQPGSAGGGSEAVAVWSLVHLTVDNLVEASVHGFSLCLVYIHPTWWHVRLGLLDYSVAVFL